MEGGGVFDNLDEPSYLEKRDANEVSNEYVDQENMRNDQRNIRSEQNFEYSNEFNGAEYDQIQDGQPMNQLSERGKRDNDIAAMHGGILSNKKSMMKSKIRNKQNFEMENDGANEIENDFFGGLPQNYREGELNRYKRVKRTNDVNKFKERNKKR